MKENEYKSSVLTCECGEERSTSCDVCMFLNGNTDKEILLKVLGVLDRELACSQETFDLFLDSYVKEIHKKIDHHSPCQTVKNMLEYLDGPLHLKR